MIAPVNLFALVCQSIQNPLNLISNFSFYLFQISFSYAFSLLINLPPSPSLLSSKQNHQANSFFKQPLDSNQVTTSQRHEFSAHTQLSPWQPSSAYQDYPSYPTPPLVSFPSFPSIPSLFSPDLTSSSQQLSFRDPFFLILF